MITYRNMGKLGRLGNALFQIASTIGIAARRREPVVFPADWKHRKWFSLPNELFSDNIPDEAVNANTLITNMDPRDAEYMQDVNLFLPYLDEIRTYFAPSPAAHEVLDQIKLPEGLRVCAHVRLGDKINDPGQAQINDYFIQPSTDWYRRGVFAQLNDWNSKLCVFSDSIDVAREVLPHAEFYGDGVQGVHEWKPEFAESEPMDWVDFFLMAQCQRFVISGSTMGIWAALLAGAEGNAVIRPDKVYGPALARVNSELLFRSDWSIYRVA